MTRFTPQQLRHPIVAAPMAGGPSTAALAVAVSRAGGLGFLAAGYKTPAAVLEQVRELRQLAPEPTVFGVNVFAPPGHGAQAGQVQDYARRLRDEAGRRGVTLGEPRWDDDSYAEKVELLRHERVPVVSFTFGCPAENDVDRLHAAGSVVWVTVTTPAEARAAHAVGADALVVQGVEAGGHRGSFDDAAPGDLGLLALLQLTAATVGREIPMIASGGIATGGAVASVLAAGAVAAQLGTAFMLCPEAGTAPAHRDALREAHAETVLTRAFTGRTARSINNRFAREHTAAAPSAYPEVHHLTSALRNAARTEGDPDGFHLWAGQTYSLVDEVPAAQMVERLAGEARAALAEAADRLPPTAALLA